MGSTTYRERREARAERLREWAGKREAKAEAASTQAHMMAQAIPFGQPILVGHHSEGRDRNYRARMAGQMDKAVEHSRKAESMNSRAANIEAALDSSIYDDDLDAIQRLEERIAGREAERERIKAYNASCRKGQRDLSILTEAERTHLLRIAEVAPYSLGKQGQYPAYHLSNLGGVITKDRQRLARLTTSR